MSFADTLFHRAVSTGDAQAVKTMLTAGADVNARNENGHTPITYAIVAGQYHLLSLLLRAGANPTLRDHTGLSAIDWAERKGRPDLAKSLTSAATDTASIHPQEISPRPAVDEKQRPSISADEKSRRFIAGLRQRLEEKANRTQPNDELQSQASEIEHSTREVTDERRPIFRETATREETIVEPQHEAPHLRQRLEEEANRTQLNDELQSQSSKSDHSTGEVTNERRPIFRETATREETKVEPQHEAPYLRQRLEEEANRTQLNDELQSQSSESDHSTGEVTDERRPIFRETATREETIVEPQHEAPYLRQRLEEEANRKLANDELQPEPASKTEQTNRELTDERRRIFRETAARDEEAIVEPTRKTEQTNRELTDERRRIFRETAARDEATVEPTRRPGPAISERPAPPSVAAFDVTTLPKSPSLTSTTGFESHTSSHRKRCPRCGATYDSEVLAYCVYHEVALIGADEPMPAPPAENRSPILLWVLVLIAVTVGGLGGLFVTGALFKSEPPNTPAPTAPLPLTQKGIPTLEKRLAGKEVSLPEAEVPANTVQEPTTIKVRVKINRDGRVSSASATDGDQVFIDAAIKAAKMSSFSAQHLRGRGAEGTITYTFK